MPKPSTLRACALYLIDVLDRVGDDVLAAEKELSEAVGFVLALPGLESVLANPAQTGVDPRTASTGWLYQDGDLRIVRGRMPAGMYLGPHNHGSWNLFGVYRGAVKYTSYRRLDDRSIPYYADLGVAEDRILRDGDVTVLPGPPHDIHAVRGLAETSTTVLVARGPFSDEREEYQPEERCYIRYRGDGFGAAR